MPPVRASLGSPSTFSPLRVSYFDADVLHPFQPGPRQPPLYEARHEHAERMLRVRPPAPTHLDDWRPIAAD